MNPLGLQERAPAGELTDYDREHAALYLRLLDAEAAGADWREVAQVVMRLDVGRGVEKARLMHATHLARAQWLRDEGYQHLLRLSES
ncbi:DNA -binding domain-containing protein [Phenylobacterium soli]|uniref:T6SS Transcription factor RovC-like DNA binding domain-containing protein n=1 Tax=Phenylobacterium soli TaxID=2170551 RepID=A0A328AKC4_9CAUL|nr:DUF2285 domain-containing protein [Phenylobacterium soli]RAK54921.1 hypothetical protein DJ017_10465 [Phenylobacterium soli]